MSLAFEELDHARTRFGELVLRRRRSSSLPDTDIFEVKLDGQFLMSSLVNDSEIALAKLGLAELPGRDWDVVVGGLGLGCTAAAALEHAALRSLLVIEALPEVIAWHRRGLVPLGARLTGDARCRLVQGDFFALARGAGAAAGFDPADPARRFHAVLVDIDHSPRGLLHDSHADFYDPAGLAAVARVLHPGGVFALWSAEAPDEAFTRKLAAVFATARAEAVEFLNPLLDHEDVNTIYVARTAEKRAAH